MFFFSFLFFRSCNTWCGTEASANSQCNENDLTQSYPHGTKINSCKCYQKGSKGIAAAYIAGSTCPFRSDTGGTTGTGTNTGTTGGATKMCGDCKCSSIVPNEQYISAPGFDIWCSNPAFKGDNRFCDCPGGGKGTGTSTSVGTTGTSTGGGSNGGTGECKPGEQKPIDGTGSGTTGTTGTASTSGTAGTTGASGTSGGSGSSGTSGTTGTTTDGTTTGGTGTGTGAPVTPTPPTTEKECPVDATQVIVPMAPMNSVPTVGYVGKVV